MVKNNNVRNAALLLVAFVLLASGIYYFGGFSQTKSFEGGICTNSNTAIEISYHLDSAAAPSLPNKIAACTPPSNITQQGAAAQKTWILQNNPTWTGKMEILVTSPSYPDYKATLCSKTGTFHCGYNYVAGGSDDCNYRQVPFVGNGNYVFTVYLYPTGQPSFVSDDISRSVWSFTCAGAAKTCTSGGKTYQGGLGGGLQSLSCLSTQPQYCDASGTIINLADVCGCPSGQSNLGGTTCSGVCHDTDGNNPVDHCVGNVLWYNSQCVSPPGPYSFSKQDCGTSSTCLIVKDTQGQTTGARCANANTPALLNTSTECTNTCAATYTRTPYPECHCTAPQNSLCNGTKPINSCNGNTLQINYECNPNTGQWTPASTFPCGDLTCSQGVCVTPTAPSVVTGHCSEYTLDNVPAGSQCEVELKCAAAGGTVSGGECSVSIGGGGATTCSDDTPTGQCSQVQVGYLCTDGQLALDNSCINGGGAVNTTCSGDAFSICADNKTLVKTVCGSDYQWTPIGGQITDCSILGLSCIDNTCKAGTVPTCTADTLFKCPSDNKTIVLKTCANGQLTLTNNKCAGKQPEYCDYNTNDLTCIINAHLLEIGGGAVLVIVLLVAVFVYMKTRTPGRRRR